MEWISVKDRLPDCKKFLAIHVSDKEEKCNLRHDGWFMDTIYACYQNAIGKFIIESHGPLMHATHWMPLPEPPK